MNELQKAIEQLTPFTRSVMLASIMPPTAFEREEPIHPDLPVRSLADMLRPFALPTEQAVLLRYQLRYRSTRHTEGVRIYRRAWRGKAGRGLAWQAGRCSSCRFADQCATLPLHARRNP